MRKEVNLPETPDDITLAQWQEILVLAEKELDPDFYMRRVLKIVYGLEIEEISRIHAKDITVLAGAIEKIINEANKKTSRFTQRFKLHGTEYGFIPNLDNMTFAEFTDLDLYAEVKDYHKLMSILFRPVTRTHGDRYEIEPYKGSGDLGDMPLGIALGAVGFFLDIGSQLTGDILNSLKPEERRIPSKSPSARNGVGTGRSIPLPTGTS